MGEWLDEAADTLRLVAAAGVLAVGIKLRGRPAAAATCDQVTALFQEMDSWLKSRPCPDAQFDAGLHYYFAHLGELISRQEMTVHGLIDSATLEEIVELAGLFLAWLNERLDEIGLQ